MKNLIFIPSYNDQAELSKLIEELIYVDTQNFILVIDDGSDTPLVNVNISDRVIFFRIPFNAGIGVATNIAMDYAIINKFNYFIRIDADGQHHPKYVNQILKNLKNLNTDMIVGTRINHKSYGNLRNALATIVKLHMSFLLNKISTTKLNDWSTGFFALNQLAIEKLAVFSYDRYPEVELYLRAAEKELKIATLDIFQLKRNEGNSSLNLLTSVKLLIRFYLILIRYCIERVRKL
jgi:glycosyltransferase involved in cell wall biosynthesis